MLDTITDTAPHACLECSNRWAHIGTDQPDPECPNCESPAVTPLGEIAVETVEELEVADGIASHFWRIPCTDATERTFTFMYGVNEESAAAELVWLVISFANGDGDIDAQLSIDVTEQGSSWPDDHLPLAVVEEELAATRRRRERPTTSATTSTGGVR